MWLAVTKKVKHSSVLTKPPVCLELCLLSPCAPEKARRLHACPTTAFRSTRGTAWPAFSLHFSICDVSTFPLALICPASCPLVFALFSQRVDSITFSSVGLRSPWSQSMLDFSPILSLPFFSLLLAFDSRPL